MGREQRQCEALPMKRKFQAIRRQSQRGVVAVETALVMPILVLFITFPTIFWAFYFFEYSSAQKAVHDASLYLSTAPKLEMAAVGPDGRPAALTLAGKIVAREMTGLNPPDLGIVCNYKQASSVVVSKPCSTTNNQSYTQTLVQLTVSLDMSYKDPLTGLDSGLWISPYADVRYMGN